MPIDTLEMHKEFVRRGKAAQAAVDEIVAAERLEVFDCEQYSDEWRRLRLGIPTASRISDVMAGGEGIMRTNYLRDLAGELVSGEPCETFKSAAMERGSMMESALRQKFALQERADPKPCGFAKRRLQIGHVGCSPDSLLGDYGVLQIKSANPRLLIGIMRAGRVPPEHVPQCQCEMMVLGRQYCMLAIGYTGMPLFVRRIARDEAYIKRLEVGLHTFNAELAKEAAWVEAYDGSA